jgi:TRAP-type C4-dicarboxylate transport system permease small subunit
MYENKTDALAPMPVFYRRVLYNLFVVCIMLAFCLTIGILGYHYSDSIPWIDSLHNASMILSGMGPVVEIKSTAGKLFSSFYALFSGVAFITNIGILLAPLAHRLYHSLHLQDED